MAIKRTGELSFVDALLPQGVGGKSRLDRLVELVKWYRFEKLLARLRDEGPGRPAFPPLVMFKGLLLQALYGLSDAELEGALADRLSFRRFIGLSLTDQVITARCAASATCWSRTSCSTSCLPNSTGSWNWLG